MSFHNTNDLQLSSPLLSHWPSQLLTSYSLEHKSNRLPTKLSIILHCLWSKIQTLKSTTITTIIWSYFSSMPHFSLMHTSNWSTHFSSSHHISSPFTLLLTSDLSILLPSPHTDVLHPLLIGSLFLISEYLNFNAHMQFTSVLNYLKLRIFTS